jgi:leucyl-tRNA synthetase
MQKKWIGKKEGIEITYPVADISETITCFTTRPDTNFGATFIVLAPDHTFVKKIISGEIKVSDEMKESITNYSQASLTKTEEDRAAVGRKKTGVFTGFYAINQLTNKQIPIWISDFVLSGFGTGAVVGVPGHDLRDFEFAQAMGIEIIRVVMGKDNDTSLITKKEQVQEDEGLMINSEFLNGLTIHDATQKMMDHLVKKGWGKKVTTYHLRDWIFSRQRYWGEPIPMIYCKACKKKGKSFFTEKETISKYNQTVYKDIEKRDDTFYLDEETQKNMAGWFPLFDEELPLKLPYVKSYEPNASGKSPLADIADFVKAPCPCCGEIAERETDTMPNWAGSCWYFLRFADPHNNSQPWDTELLNKALPVDWYLGGAEHAVLHLLYSRFWIKALYDLGLVDFVEPFLNLRNVGMVLAEDHKKMSKSVGNVINPDDVISEYGADALRVYVMFMAPFNAENPWSTSSLQGSYRFLQRIWQIYNNLDKLTNGNVSNNNQLVAELQSVIASVSSDITNVKYNTAIAHLMSYLNNWDRNGTLAFQDGKKYLQLLAPFAPFLTDHIWRTIFNQKESIHLSVWPKADSSISYKKTVKIAIQVNGKVRAVLEIKDGALEEDIINVAKQVENVKKYIEGKSYNVIYIKEKVLNFIVE